MACLINLINQLTGNVSTTDANWYYLGYNSESQIDASINDPTANGGVGDNGSNCFGITDPTVPNGTYNETPAVDLPPTITVGSPLPPNQQVDFDNVSPGFYGFYYIAGDTNGNGVIDGAECGEIECIEIQVLPSPQVMEACGSGGATVDCSSPCETICVANLPQTINLDTYITNYIAGGTWGGNGTTSPGFTLTGNSLEIDNTVTPLCYTITYTFDGTSFNPAPVHPLEPCTDCETVISFTIDITPTASAGIGDSVSICN